MLEKKTKSYIKILIIVLKIFLILWTLYLLTYLIMSERYNSLKCKEKDKDKCKSDTIFTKAYHTFHPFNFHKYRLPDTPIIGGNINMLFIVTIIVLSGLILSSEKEIILSNKYLAVLLVTVICIIYHMVNLISEL